MVLLLPPINAARDGAGGRKGAPSECEAQEEEGSSRAAEVGEIPQGGGDGCFWLLSPPWTRFLVTQRKESIQTVLIRPENRNQDLQAPWSGFPHNSTTFPSPNSTHISWDQDSPPTKQIFI